VGGFFTLEDAPVVNISVRNVTLVANRADWSCASRGNFSTVPRDAHLFDKKQKKGRIYACDGSAVDVTPPLSHGGCVQDPTIGTELYRICSRSYSCTVLAPPQPNRSIGSGLGAMFIDGAGHVLDVRHF
jgi:hypothetical protein